MNGKCDSVLEVQFEDRDIRVSYCNVPATHNVIWNDDSRYEMCKFHVRWYENDDNSVVWEI